MTGSAPSSFRPAGPLVSDPLAPYNGAWNTNLAAHLARRAGFGGSPAEIARLSAMSMDAAVDSFVKFPPTDHLAAAPPLVDDEEQRRMQLLQARRENGGRGRFFAGAGRAALTDEQRMELRQMRRAQAADNIAWWMTRMMQTPAPLQEKMTLYLHGHFATAENTKGIYGTDIIDQNQLFRKYALGNWQELTHYVARDRAMLKWLDNAASKKDHPNENFARELMELFTLGIGNYTETDVRESARAFTGYTFSRFTGEFEFNHADHDDGSKTFLGQTGNFDGDAIIDIIFTQRAATTYFAKRMLEFFLYTDPEPELINAFAALIRKNKFEMLPVMSTLFRSNVFYSNRAYRALVKSPIEFVVGSYRLFGVTDFPATMIPVLTRMGQTPFHPPSVKGWDGGSAWLNTQTVLARENFASTLMAMPTGMAAAADAPPSMSSSAMSMNTFLLDGLPANAQVAAQKIVGAILQGDASPKSMADLEAYIDGKGTSADGTLSGENVDERMRGAAYLTMAMPAYQLA
jgi:uncharacterized protein (DUF1800 family)